MTLRPSLRTRVVYFVLALLVLVLAVGATFYAPAIGIVGLLFAGFATVNGAFRLFHPRSYATVLGADGFEVFGALGNRVHRIRWSQIAHLTVFNGNGLRGAGTELHLAWRCEPRCPGHGRQPWVRGGRNNVGEEYDGALPAPYLGIEEMLALFSRHI
jgi:hypothetical protein